MTFYFPPRPDNAIHRDLIKMYEGRGWVAQIKKNGTCSVVDVSSEGTPDYWTRHGERHKAWTPTPQVSGFFASFPNSTFVFELLHNKTPDIKDTAYVFDLLKFKGQVLAGMTLDERLGLLENITPFSDKVIIAKTYRDSLTGLYDSLSADVDEGIVLKNPEAMLKYPHKADSNSSWQVKCRRATKNFGF